MLAKKLVQKGVQGRRFRRRANVKGTGGDSAPQLGVEASEEQLVVACHAAEHCVLGAVALLRTGTTCSGLCAEMGQLKSKCE